MAVALAAEGARVAIVARNRDRVEAAAAEIGARGFVADVSREEEVERLERDVTGTVGRIGILINNAGINIRKPLSEFTLDEWKRVMDTNLTSVFLMCRAFVPHMKGTGYGRILNLTSTMSHVSLPGRSVYSASKTALLGLTRALALELAPDGVTVNGISPGPFGTEMNTILMQDPKLNAEFMSYVPLKRWGRVEEVGALAAYLCSEEAGFITGTDILMDGGWCAR
jgi:NAD(P)-dependent dehydrogenase (short-subunit alcohol dehydrogenase family)